MWLSDFYLWAQGKIHCIFSCLSCLGWFGFVLLWVGCWDLGSLFKRKIQTIEWPCRLHALAVSETKHRQWANETRQEHWENMKKQDRDTSNKGWGYGAEKMPEVMGDGESGRVEWIIENTTSQLLKVYTQNLSNRTKVSRRPQFSEQKTCPEIQVYVMRALLISLAQTKLVKSKILHQLFIQHVCLLTNKPGAPIARTFCVQIFTCLAFIWPIWVVQRFSHFLSHQTIQVLRR